MCIRMWICGKHTRSKVVMRPPYTREIRRFDPYRVYMARIHLNKEPKELEPSLFLVTLQAGQPGKGITVYTNYVVAHIPEDAIEIVTQTLQNRDVKIYNEGLKLGGWRYMMHHAIPATKIEGMFNDVGVAVKKAKAEKRGKDKNELMKTIIENKDITLLHQHIALFSDAEQAYIHEKITA